MSWLLCCVRPKASGESAGIDKCSCAAAIVKSASPSKAPTGNTLSVCLSVSLDQGEQGEEPSMPQSLLHAPSSRVRKASQCGLRLSEDTLTSALSTTTTSLNPLAYVLPFVNDDTDDFSVGHAREEVAAPSQPRSKVDFADLCGSLEDLAYLGEGSNGVVYSASWHGARVAVKFMLGSDDDGTYLQRCLTEAVLTRVLSHPCVVQCFATSIAQLTPELWEAIHARCRRHASLLQSTSLGRSVAAAVLQQEQLERTSALEQCCWDLQLQQPLSPLQAPQQSPQQLVAAASDRRLSLQALRSQSSLQQSRQSQRQMTPRQQLPPQPQSPPLASRCPRNGYPHQQQQPQQPPQNAQSSHSLLQSQVLLLPPQDRVSAGGGPLPRGDGGGGGQCGDCDSSDQALTDLSKITTFCTDDLNPQHYSNTTATITTSTTIIDQQPSIKVVQLQPQELPRNSRPALPPTPAPHPYQQPQSGGGGVCLVSSLLEQLPSDAAVASGAGGGNGGGCDSVCAGISLLQALTDLKAEVGRHCTVVVMEHMDAGTLHAAVVRGDFSARRSPEHRSKLLALLLTAQELAQGMAHLHALDILHGDLKPTNVLLKGSPCRLPGLSSAAAVMSGQTGAGGSGGRAGSAGSAGGGGGGLSSGGDPRGYTAKIADLGLARPLKGGKAEELPSDEWGALAYLAPEAAKGSCCKASDVYSFGVMLWEMSAGVRPYLGLTTPQVLMGLVTGTLALTWPSDSSLYAPLRSLAVACTHLQPAERPSFEVAARILGRMVRHIRAASEPLRQRHSSARSMEAPSAAAAVAAAAAGGGDGGSLYSPGSGGGRYVLNHASRSMPSCLQIPTATGAPAAVGGGGSGAAAAGTLRTGSLQPPVAVGADGGGGSGGLSRGPMNPAPISAALLAAASHLYSRGSSGGGTNGEVAAGSGPSFPASSGSGGGGGTSTRANAGTSSIVMGAAGLGAGPGVGPAAGAGSGAFWAAMAPQSQPQPYPRTRHAAGSGVCGAALLRSPLGTGAGGPGASGAPGLRTLPSCPGVDPRVAAGVAGGAHLLPATATAVRAALDRPGASPMHPYVVEALGLARPT